MVDPDVVSGDLPVLIHASIGKRSSSVRFRTQTIRSVHPRRYPPTAGMSTVFFLKHRTSSPFVVLFINSLWQYDERQSKGRSAFLYADRVAMSVARFDNPPND
jgi:hypothetical protein